VNSSTTQKGSEVRRSGRAPANPLVAAALLMMVAAQAPSEAAIMSATSVTIPALRESGRRAPVGEKEEPSPPLSTGGTV
jgi:hypothetical protein